MKWNRLQYAPDERGGAASQESTGDEDSLEVDGETFSRKELEDFRNQQNWKRAQKERDDAIQAEKKRVELERQTLAEERRALAAEKARLAESSRTPQQQKAEDTLEGLGIDLSDLPSPLDDEKAYNAALARKMNDAVKQGLGKAISQLKAEMAQGDKRATEQATSTAANQVARERAFSRNRQLVDSYFQEAQVSGEDRAKIERWMDKNMRLDGYGEEDASGVWLFTRDAVEAADFAIRRDYWKSRFKEEGYQEGLSQRQRTNGNLGLGGHGGGKRPGKNATTKELYDYASKLPPNSPAAQRFFEDMTPEQLDNYLSYSAEEEIAATGGV